MNTKDDFIHLKPKFLSYLERLLGAEGFSTRKDTILPYLSEQRGNFNGSSQLLIRPKTTNQLSEIMKRCSSQNLKIVPIGGNTGLSGGCVPSENGDEILLSLERMNSIRNFDETNYTITVEAGCILSDIKSFVEKRDFFFPLGLASEGSCQIGGNLATNAGGINVLRFGNTRELVLGLEAVLPDGKIWNGLRSLHKDNMGYSLKNLFIGSEGTLCLITAASLKLFPKQIKSKTILCCLNKLTSVIELLNLTKKLSSETLTSFELLSNFGVDLSIKHHTQIRFPIENKFNWYALIHLSSSNRNINLEDNLESIFSLALKKGIIEDAIISKSESQENNLWKVRESLSNAQKLEGGSIKHDVSVPIDKIPFFIEMASKEIIKYFPGSRPCPFGHIGDGNIHFNISQPKRLPKDVFLEKSSEINKIVYDIVMELNGSISAEHGIGMLKTKELENYRSNEEIELMHKIKKAIDPENIMNPNKVLNEIR